MTDALCESCGMHTGDEWVALRHCVIDDCDEVSVVHVPGYPDCVDHCKRHNQILYRLDEEMTL